MNLEHNGDLSVRIQAFTMVTQVIDTFAAFDDRISYAADEDLFQCTVYWRGTTNEGAITVRVEVWAEEPPQFDGNSVRITLTDDRETVPSHLGTGGRVVYEGPVRFSAIQEHVGVQLAAWYGAMVCSLTEPLAIPSTCTSPSLSPTGLKNQAIDNARSV